MSGFYIPEDYKYVAAALCLIPSFSVYCAYTTIQARKAGDVKLPLLFASEEDAAKNPLKNKFNCVQKSGMNYYEHAPTMFYSALISGLTFPKITAILVVAWVVARYMYHVGYSAGDPKGRFKGGWGALVMFVTLLGAYASAFAKIFM